MSLIPPTRRPTKHIQLRCNTDHVPTIDLNADLGKVSARGISATTTPCSASSRAPISPADSTPAAQRDWQPPAEAHPNEA